MGLLKHRDRDDLVQAVAALNDQEWTDLVNEARQESLIPLAHLVIEGLAPDIGNLAQRLGAEVTVDDVGRRCVTRRTAARLFTERAAADEQLRARYKLQRDEARAKGHPVRERVRALQQRQSTGDPWADLHQESAEAAWQRAAEQRAEAASGDLVYHPVRREV